MVDKRDSIKDLTPGELEVYKYIESYSRNSPVHIRQVYVALGLNRCRAGDVANMLVRSGFIVKLERGLYDHA